jgi:hypothetical protein
MDEMPRGVTGIKTAAKKPSDAQTTTGSGIPSYT